MSSKDADRSESDQDALLGQCWQNAENPSLGRRDIISPLKQVLALCSCARGDPKVETTTTY